MMAATYEELMQKSRQLAQSGDIESARRVAQIALQRKGGAQTSGDSPFTREHAQAAIDNHQTKGQKIGNFLNKAGEAMTMGLIGDEASAAVESLVPGVSYGDRLQHYRQQEENFERDHPVAALTADIGGSMVAPVAAFGAIKAAPGAMNMAKRMAASAGATGAMSGVYGFAEGEGGLQSRMENAKTSAATGAAMGAAFPLAGAGVQKVADMAARRKIINALIKKAPTTAQKRAEADDLYRQVRNAGITIRPDVARNQMAEIAEYLQSEGVGKKAAKKIMPSSRAILNEVKEFGEGANTVPFQDVEISRRFMGHAAGANLQNAGDTRIATEAMSKLDDFIANLKPDDVDAGDVEALKRLLPKARETWAQMRRSQTIDDAIDAGQDYMSGEASGIRNQFRRIVKSPKLRRGFSDAEIKMMRKVINNSGLESIAHYIGSGLGMMGTIGGGVGAGAAAGGPVGGVLGGMAAAGAAHGARQLSSGIARKRAEIVRAIVASGGLPKMPTANPASAAIVEQLLRQGTAAVPQ